MDRRSFLKLATIATVTPAVVVDALQTSHPPSAKRLLQLNAYPLDAETPLDLLNTYITPNDLFFVRSHFVSARVNADAWMLTIDGAVSRPMDLTLADLRKLPRAEATCVLQCAGNGRSLFKPTMPGVQWRQGAVGNARWSGVRVKEVLERAGLKGSARHLHTFGSDVPPRQVPPFHRSLEIEKVIQDGIIAFEMNGEPLWHEHGAPVRLIVPGWAGDHWMKWLKRISPSPTPQSGFYMDTAYQHPSRPGNPITELFVKSTITSAPLKARAGAPVTMGGFAFSGAPDIARVEVTEDEGHTWRSAELDSRHDPYAWRLWSYRWTPASAGVHRLMVRAIDSRGSTQPRDPVWNQSGYLHNGWHSITVEVRA
jgi:DMSO/TMAO reductase YedYZ molybdopterin-dependent catalytic subunit